MTLVGMEATGVYWKPVHWVLEDAIERGVGDQRPSHAQRAGPQDRRRGCVSGGRSCSSMAWCGRVSSRRGRFREQRDLTRYRKSVIEERGRETQRLHKVLEDAGVKLSSVASSVLTKSGREMIDALDRRATRPRGPRGDGQGPDAHEDPRAAATRWRAGSTSTTR